MTTENQNRTASKPHTHGQFRFGIRHLFYGVALVASGLVVLGPFSIVVSTLVMGFWAIVYFSRPKIGPVGCLIAVFLAMILIGFLMPAVQQVREAARRVNCINNMRQLMFACFNYESSHGHFPQAHQVDEDGKPMHSWRVLILPFIDEPTLYAAYRFDEPWDGPNNSQIASQCPYVFQCPSAPQVGDKTIYKLVTGPNAFFSEDKKVSFSDAPDGSATAIVMVEDPGNPVNWMKPEDIGIEEAIKTMVGLNVQHAHRDDSAFRTVYKGSNAAFLNGSAMSISPMVEPELLRQSMNVRDGVGPDLDLVAGYYVVHKPHGYVALAVYLILLGLPGYLLRREPSA